MISTVLGCGTLQNEYKFGQFRKVKPVGEQCHRCQMLLPSIQCGNKICEKTSWCKTCTIIQSYVTGNAIRENAWTSGKNMMGMMNRMTMNCEDRRRNEKKESNDVKSNLKDDEEYCWLLLRELDLFDCYLMWLLLKKKNSNRCAWD